jgi:hypothetical protein
MATQERDRRAHSPAEIERLRVQRSPLGIPADWTVVARPFGYAGLGIAWLFVFLMIVAAATATPALLGRLPLGQQPIAHTWYGITIICLMVPLLSLACGYLVVAIPVFAAAKAALSFTFVARSLRPSYRGEKLSMSGHARRDLGPVEALPDSLSLIPVRMDPWTRFWRRAHLAAWLPGSRVLVALVPAGLAYVLVAGMVAWPVRDPLWLIVWSSISLVGVVVAVVGLVREVPRRIRPVGYPDHLELN